MGRLKAPASLCLLLEPRMGTMGSGSHCGSASSCRGMAAAGLMTAVPTAQERKSALRDTSCKRCTRPVPWELEMLLKLRKTQVSREPDMFMGLKTIFRDTNLQM